MEGLHEKEVIRMRVKDIMSKDVETITQNESAVVANERMWRQQIHHLVVMEDKTIVGVLSDTDLGGSEANTIPDDLQVKDVMSKKVVTINSNATIKDAVNLMRGHEIHSLPVVENNTLVGIVTSTDIINLEKRGVAHGPYQGLEQHQGDYIPQHERERSGTSKTHHTDWPGL
jgi:CBS domain-containing protein